MTNSVIMKAVCKKKHHTYNPTFDIKVGIEYEYKYFGNLLAIYDKNGVKNMFLDSEFNKYFYTTQELRKLKLLKLNQTR